MPLHEPWQKDMLMSDADNVPLIDDSLNLNETFISHQREQDLITGRTQNSSNLHALRIMEENVGNNFSRDRVIAEQGKKPDHIPIFKRSLPSKEANKVSECFYLNNGVLMRKWRPLDASLDEEWRVIHQIVVPGLYCQYILDIAHDTPMSGHLGINKTYRKIQNHFYWPRLKQDVAQYRSSCHTCQMCGKPNQKSLLSIKTHFCFRRTVN